MFGSEILEVATGLFFIFLLLSLVASSVREGIESVMRTRSADLHRGVSELLDRDPALIRKLYTHPLVHSLYLDDYREPRPWRLGKARTNLPSYIPAPNFALALLDMAARGDLGTKASTAPAGATASLAQLKKTVADLPPGKLSRAVQIAVDRAEGDVGRAQENVETWFNSSMDRVSGWYKRRTQYILFAIGLVVAVAANVDTIAIARYLYQNDTARTAVAVRAEVFTAAANESGGLPDSVSSKLRETINGELDALRAAGLPIGWRQKPPATAPARPVLTRSAPPTSAVAPPVHPTNYLPTSRAELGSAVLTHVFGWLLSAFAISLGAPFWFDVLNKVMVIRSTVKPNEKSLPEASEDRQPKGAAAAFVGRGTTFVGKKPPVSTPQR